jgi:hypothetical protein
MRAYVIAALHPRGVSRGRNAGRGPCRDPAAAAEEWPLAGVLGVALNGYSRQFGQQKQPDSLSWVLTPLIGAVSTHDNECAISAPYASEMADVLGAEVTYAAS